MDDDISFQSGIISGDPQTAILKSYPWNKHAALDLFPVETPDCYSIGLPSAV